MRKRECICTKYTQDMFDRFCELIETGLTRNEAANKLGMTYTGILIHLNQDQKDYIDEIRRSVKGEPEMNKNLICELNKIYRAPVMEDEVLDNFLILSE